MAEEQYEHGSSQGESYRGVYGLTTPREKIYGYDKYGQRKEVVPIKEVAGLELEEYKFRCLQEIMEANRTIIGAVRDSLESLQEAIATDVTENQIKIITDELSKKGTIISKQLDALTSSLEKYKKESIDIKDYPDYL